MNAPSPRPPSIIAIAKQMAREGYGYEDIADKLKIDKRSAYWFVFGKEMPRKGTKE